MLCFNRRRHLKKLVLLFAVLCMSAGCARPIAKPYFPASIPLDLSRCKLLEHTDTHGGFLGDGIKLLTYDCGMDEEAILAQTDQWPRLPLPENVRLLLYGGEKNGVFYAYNFAEDFSIPQIANGRYYFYDRHAEASDPWDSAALFDRYSFNLSLFLYDKDAKLLYCFELDT